MKTVLMYDINTYKKFIRGTTKLEIDSGVHLGNN